MSFLELPIQEQLKTLCEKPGFFNKLNYRFNRSKAQDNCYEDIYDGNIYTQNNLLQNDDHISLLWNTDGKPIFKSSHVSIWPLYFLINELPISDRFDMKNMIFAGLWFGPTKPSMLTFLEPFYRSLASLETTGVDVQPHMAANPINIKVHLLLGTCDKPAKSLVQNFMQYNGNYGCGKCEQPGMTYKTSQKGHTHIYPYQTSNPSGPLRTKCETLRYADLAIQTGKPVKGVKGPSWFGALKSYDTVQGLQVDYMHSVLIGVVSSFTNLWFDSSNSKQQWYIGKYNVVVDERIKNIRPPDRISRIPRPISERCHWKASEFRNWLLYYSPVLLFGILPNAYYNHYILLVSAVYILLQKSILPSELVKAERQLRKFVMNVTELYGQRYMSSNVHDLLHLPQCVRDAGPLFLYSCFHFEDLNGRLEKYFHGTQSVPEQIVSAVSLIQKLPYLIDTSLLDDVTHKLYNKLAFGGCKKLPSLRCQLGNGCFVVGHEHKKVLPHCLITNLLTSLPRGEQLPKEILCFYRVCIKNSVVIDSSAYTKTKRRINHCVLYSNVSFGLVQFYIRFNEYSYAIIKRIFTSGPITPNGQCVEHIQKITLIREELEAVPINTIQYKCIFLSTVGHFGDCVAFFPNLYERD